MFRCCKKTFNHCRNYEYESRYKSSKIGSLSILVMFIVINLNLDVAVTSANKLYLLTFCLTNISASAVRYNNTTSRKDMQQFCRHRFPRPPREYRHSFYLTFLHTRSFHVAKTRYRRSCFHQQYARLKNLSPLQVLRYVCSASQSFLTLRCDKSVTIVPATGNVCNSSTHQGICTMYMVHAVRLFYRKVEWSWSTFSNEVYLDFQM